MTPRRRRKIPRPCKRTRVAAQTEWEIEMLTLLSACGDGDKK